MIASHAPKGGYLTMKVRVLVHRHIRRLVRIQRNMHARTSVHTQSFLGA